MGNGGVVRGSYKGALLFRYHLAQVLIVCETSSFYPHQTTSPTFPARSETPVQINYAVSRPQRGVIFRLEKDFLVHLGSVNESCDVVCRTKQTTCSVEGLWLINEHCDVIIYYSNKRCTVCNSLGKDAYADGVLPALNSPGKGTYADGVNPALNPPRTDTYADGVLPALNNLQTASVCYQAYPHYISCSTASPHFSRLCVCDNNKKIIKRK